MNSNTISALFIGINENRGASLVSAFHRLGYVCRHSNITEMGALGSAIRSDNPDLLLFNEVDSQIDLSHCLDAIKNNPIDLPIVVLSDNAERLPDHRIADVLDTHDNARIARSCLREFWALQTRRALSDTRTQLKAAEARSELILSQSEDAIAYIAEGIIINVNKHFAGKFGFDDPDDLDCQPIIDLINRSDQDRLKNALRSLKGDKHSTQICLSARHQDGSDIDAKMKLTTTTLDDCVQFAIIDESSTGTNGEGSAAIDALTGFSSSDYFCTRLDDIAAHGLGRNLEGALLLVGLDRYAALRADHGISGADLLVQDLAALLLDALPAAEFGRIASDMIGIIISGFNSKEALAAAQSLCTAIERRSVTIRNDVTGYTSSIAVLPITPAKQPSAQLLLDYSIALCEEIRDQAGGSGNTAKLYVRARQQLTKNEDPSVLFENAKSDKRLQLKYQPIVSLAEDGKQYYEICLTLKDQTEDEITGEGLLAAFEALGDNTELDRWIIVEATKQAVQNCKAGGQTRLIINLSSNVFNDKGLTPWLNVALKAAELPADSLVFQFRAESCAKSLKPAIGFATKLRATGANIALCSSNPVSYDKNALTQLKPLLTKLNVDIQNSENISAAIQTVKEAGSKAIVTGVESATTLATLWQLKPDYVQGSYIRSPTSSMDYDFGDG
ncbi:MAG: EAL domain-containing protein (putative c-di-GMP-specific phosphodiesterase class I) [Bacteroidia bacterium]|jgi:EAL domain-containing protein (putative c-di-GMP-specific phosphodiesterase class I)/GGDEF domain-containing protein